MTDPEKAQLEAAKERLQGLLKRVPNSVNSGSYDAAVAYKKHAKKAQAHLASARVKLVDLTQAYQQLSQYQ